MDSPIDERCYNKNQPELIERSGQYGTVEPVGIMPAPKSPENKCCGDVWGTQCQVIVQPPDFSHDDHPDVCRIDLSAAKVDSNVLAAFIDSTNENVRTGIAMNTTVPGHLLTALSQDSNIKVRIEVAGNPSTPPDTLVVLSIHDLPVVRRELASNPSTPAATLIAMLTASTTGSNIRKAILHNSTLPDYVRAIYVLGDI